MPISPWQFAAGDITAPGRDLVIITPDNDNDLARPIRALVVDNAVRVTTAEGNVVDLPDLGTWEWRCQIVRVHSTGTDATVIVGIV